MCIVLLCEVYGQTRNRSKLHNQPYWFTTPRWGSSDSVLSWCVVEVCVPELVLNETRQDETGHPFPNWQYREMTTFFWSRCSRKSGKNPGNKLVSIIKNFKWESFLCVGEIFLCLISINSPTCFAHREITQILGKSKKNVMVGCQQAPEVSCGNNLIKVESFFLPCHLV